MLGFIVEIIGEEAAAKLIASFPVSFPAQPY
jgi:hypothetical protein